MKPKVNKTYKLFIVGLVLLQLTSVVLLISTKKMNADAEQEVLSIKEKLEDKDDKIEKLQKDKDKLLSEFNSKGLDYKDPNE